MLTRSTINPQPIWVRKIDRNSGKLESVLRVRWNIHTVEIDDMDGSKHTEYEYDECEIRNVLPPEVSSKEDFLTYIKANKAAILSKAKKEVEAPILVKSKTSLPWYEELDIIRAEK